MIRDCVYGAVLFCAVLAGCGPTGETPRPEPAPLSRDAAYRAGHRLYLESAYDSAAVLLKRAHAMDTAFVEPVRDLAQLYFEQGMRAPENDKARAQHLRASLEYFKHLDGIGDQPSDLYERLCELCVALNKDKEFVRYARKNAEVNPYDRQFFNLARAYFEVGDYQSVITSTKESIERFKSSPYITSFYRLLGRSYMKVDRDQTAERTLVAGVKSADTRIADMRKQGAAQSSDQWRRAHDDKINMLLALKQLHTTYKADDKLRQVERQLKEEGYDK
jgi:tetratricopeptide (TPR) repeat protein